MPIYELAALGAATCWALTGVISVWPAGHLGAPAFNRLRQAFVTVLLVAGSLALEREENAFPRLTRGLVSRSALLTEKVALGVAVGLLVTLLMLAGLAIFVPLHWGRFGLWLLAIVERLAGTPL